MDNNFQPNNENHEVKSKAKRFWAHVGLFFIALALAAVTVFVLNLNK